MSELTTFIFHRRRARHLVRVELRKKRDGLAVLERALRKLEPRGIHAGRLRSAHASLRAAISCLEDELHGRGDFADVN